MRLAKVCSIATLISATYLVGCVATQDAPNVPTNDNVDTAGGAEKDAGGDADSVDAGRPAAVVDAGVDKGPKDAGEPELDAFVPLALNCETYCTGIIDTCVGENAQYTNKEQCMNMCGDTPLGFDDDVKGDTVGCRTYHLNNILIRKQPADVHCPHAGPTGGGTCGNRCNALCDRAAKLCTAERGYPDAYASKGACLTACQADEDAGVDGFAIDQEIELPASGDTVNCRLYHLRSAYSSIDPQNADAGSAPTHCPHVAIVSDTCK